MQPSSGTPDQPAGSRPSPRRGPLDVHAHVVPAGLFTRIAAAGRPGFSAEIGADGRRSITLPGGTPSRVQTGLHSLELRLKAMDEQGVAVQLLSPVTSLAGYSLSESDGSWLNLTISEEIAAMVREMPDRFVGIGSVPLQAPTTAADLLRREMLELGLLGVAIATTVGRDRDLDDPGLEPFWTAAEELRAFILIHPHQGIRSARFAAYQLNNLIQNPLDTTTAAAHLLFGGVLERHPNLTICLAHGGGFLPYNLGRLMRGQVSGRETGAALTGPVVDSFKRLYFDSVTHFPEGLRFLIELAGPERVLLGSDYPYDMGDPHPVDTVQRGAHSREEAEVVLRDNANRLLDLAAAP